MLHRGLDRILGTTSKVRLLRILCAQHRVFSARSLSRLSEITLPAVLKALADLEAEGVVAKETAGGQFLCRINREHALVRNALEPLFQAERAAADELFAALGAAVAAPKPLAAWVFGSVARGEERPGSDLDLFVLVAHEADLAPLEDHLLEEIPAWRTRFGCRVSPMLMTLERALAQAGAPGSMVRHAVADARVLTGEIPPALRDAVDKAHDKKNKASARR
jgi:UTP:GlnB (protein PII) uridylyltransferase